MTGRGENQLDATEWFIARIIGPTCFGHLYAHHQELETILLETVLLDQFPLSRTHSLLPCT